MARAPVAENWLIFVDTNIMLDFYRMPGESVERQLQGLERHLNSIIVTEQVKMEFFKHRQKVIVESIGKLPKPNRHGLPMIVAGCKPALAMDTAINKAQASHKKLQRRVEQILRDPVRYDPVYRSLNRLFAAETPYNLKRPDRDRFAIRHAARKRFYLGYPPRKANDTSVGDALNWEWIIRCAERAENHHVLIVSRDSDYGVVYENEPIINDWLRAEFKARISRRRKIELSNKLSTALRKLDEVVREEDEAAEEQVLTGLLERHLVAPLSNADFAAYLESIQRSFAKLNLEGRLPPAFLLDDPGD